MRERRKAGRTFRLKSQEGDIETYDVLDSDTGAVIGFFVLNLTSGEVTDSTVGAFKPEDPTNRRMIARQILRYLKL